MLVSWMVSKMMSVGSENKREGREMERVRKRKWVNEKLPVWPTSVTWGTAWGCSGIKSTNSLMAHTHWHLSGSPGSHSLHLCSTWSHGSWGRELWCVVCGEKEMCSRENAGLSKGYLKLQWRVNSKMINVNFFFLWLVSQGFLQNSLIFCILCIGKSQFSKIIFKKVICYPVKEKCSGFLMDFLSLLFLL